jgi:hypothetical protein
MPAAYSGTVVFLAGGWQAMILPVVALPVIGCLACSVDTNLPRVSRHRSQLASVPRTGSRHLRGAAALADARQ